MSREWNDSQPIYRQLRDRGVHMILDGVLKEGDPLVEMKRGLGMFVKSGARDLLLKGERQKFLADEWPTVAEKIQRLGLTQKELDAAAAKRGSKAAKGKER